MADPAFIQDVPTRNQFTAAAAQTIFDYTFPIFDQVDLVIEKTKISDGLTTVLALTADYTVTGVGAQAGGTIVLTSGAAAGDIITITRQVELKRITDFSQEAAFNSKNVNLELNRMVQMDQDRDRDISQALRIPDADVNSPAQDLPVEKLRADKVLAFDPITAQPVAGPSKSVLDTLILQGVSNLTPDPSIIVASFTVAKAISSSGLVGGEVVKITAEGQGGDYLVVIGSAQEDIGVILEFDDQAAFPANTSHLKRLFVGPVNLLWFNADATGAVDVSAALLLANAFQNIIFTEGTYKVSSNLTLTSNLIFNKAAILAPDATFTITITGLISAGNHQIFGTAGLFKTSKVHQTDVIDISWFGLLPADLLTDMSDQTLADNNMLAFRRAQFMADNGIPLGIHRTPFLHIPTGLFIVDDDDSDGVGLAVKSYITILGNGDSSTVRPKDNAKTMDIFSITQDGANSIILDAFQIAGEASTQTNNQNAIVFNPPSTPNIYCYIGRKLTIKEMNGFGISIAGAGLDSSTIEPRFVRDSTFHNFLCTACDRLKLNDTIYRTAKTGFSGAVFDGAGVVAPIINNCQFDENDQFGLFVSNITGRAKINVNRASANGKSGMFFDRCDNSDLSNNYSELNGEHGILVDQCDFANFDGTHVFANSLHGLALFSSSNNSALQVKSFGNSQAADNVSSGIFVGSNSDDNNIQLATVRHLGGANQHKHGIEINDGASGTNLVTNNDLKNSGRTQALFDNGGGTITTAGNRLT